MKSLIYIFNVIINNRIHVMLMPALLTYFWNLGMRLDIPLAYYVLVCLNTGVNYLFNLKTDKDEDEINYPKEGRIFTPTTAITNITIIVFTVIASYLAFLSGWQFFLYGTVLNLFGLAYGYPIPIGGGRKFRIKSVWWIKNAYSSLFWSVSLLISPYLYLKTGLGPGLWFFIPAAFCMAFFVELLWDVRDIKGDSASGVTTIPVKFGEQTAFRTLHFFNFATLAVALPTIWLGYLNASFLWIIVHIIFCIFFLSWYKKRTDKTMGSHFYLVVGGINMLIIIILDLIIF